MTRKDKLPPEGMEAICRMCDWIRVGELYVEPQHGISMVADGTLTHAGLIDMLYIANIRWAVFIDGMSIAIRKRMRASSVTLACGDIITDRSWPQGRFLRCLETPALAVYDALLSERIPVV